MSSKKVPLLLMSLLYLSFHTDDISPQNSILISEDNLVYSGKANQNQRALHYYLSRLKPKCRLSFFDKSGGSDHSHFSVKMSSITSFFKFGGNGGLSAASLTVMVLDGTYQKT